jgi:hypothetical protein
MEFEGGRGCAVDQTVCFLLDTGIGADVIFLNVAGKKMASFRKLPVGWFLLVNTARQPIF